MKRRRCSLSLRMLQLAVVYGFGYRWDRCTVLGDSITFYTDGGEVSAAIVPDFPHVTATRAAPAA